jgi:hypothetical protein
MSWRKSAVICSLGLLPFRLPAMADAPPPALRELNSDRPDVTESPFTVDPGHEQIEADWTNFQDDRGDGGTRQWQVLPFNLRVGVTRDFEAGVFVEPWTWWTGVGRNGARETRTGFGDVTLRGKLNFFGDDGGGPALGLIVDLKVPTAAPGLGDGKVEGDVALPVALEAGEWEIDAMVEGDVVWNEARAGYRPALLSTLSIGHKISGPVSGYAELTSLAGEGPHAMTGDLGLMWLVDENTQLDAGANLGLTPAAPTLEVFSGITRRF